ncbi:hypothetical protein [Nocardioides sp. B-3]|uniref:hypothetical protein n=1 Tax=Nocardioides sp. B-3 TaxID=2895565 RepID=UPI002152BDCD|nr:hypothetical protein [Nocardioides sp. B-3]UUZ60533.1 hypothetical protein LP418_06585 [Nocardioides sp. B-3]
MESALTAGDMESACASLIALALTHDDPALVERLATELLVHTSDEVAGAAATSLGHLARIHRSLVDEALVRDRPAQAAQRTSIRGRVLDALDDLSMFTSAES